MRRMLVRIVGVVVIVAVGSVCSPAAKEAGNPHAVTVSLKCTATDITMTVDSTPRFKGTAGGNGPSGVTWKVDRSSDADDFTITPSDAAKWPFTGTPPFAATKAAPFQGKGKSVQDAGIYHYAIKATCPNNGLVVTFDPDIVVD